MEKTKKQRSNRIIAVAGNFPTPKFLERGVFVRNILLEMTRQGAHVDVIAPVSWVTALKTWCNTSHAVDFAPLRVMRPTITTIPLRFLGSLKKTGMAFNEAAMSRAVERSLPRDAQYDFCYAHFLPAGRVALKPMARRGIPVFLNLGESTPWIYDGLYDKEAWVKELTAFAGIITVSKRNQKYLLERNPELSEKVRYIPNGVDTTRFKPMDRQACRLKLGLPIDAHIAVFSGRFVVRKGYLKVLDALRHLGINGIFLGSGSVKLDGPEVLFSGSVVNDDMPQWLNAADVFVLPSLSEGMSNSILEALACGLPLVVSDLDFNREFLTGDCAMFVDPVDPVDIARGLQKCLEPAILEAMQKASVNQAQLYSIEQRIKRINEFVIEIHACQNP